MHTETSEQKPSSSSLWYLLSGAGLIVLGIVVVITKSWDLMPSYSRIGLILAAVIGLYTLGFSTRKDAKSQLVSRISLSAADLILPLAIGTSIIQSGLYTEVDATLVFLVSLISLAGYVILESTSSLPWHSLGTIFSATALAFSFGSLIDTSQLGYAILSLIPAYFFFSLAWHHIRHHNELSAKGYQSAATVLAVGGLLLLPESFTTVQPWVRLLIWIATSCAALGIACLYGFLYQKEHYELDYRVRATFEMIAPIMLGVTSFGYIVGNPTSAMQLLGIILGIVVLLASLRIPLKLLRPVGGIIITVSLIGLLVSSSKAPIFWPVLLVVGGALLMAIGSALHNPTTRKNSLSFLLSKITPGQGSFFGLGEPALVTELASAGLPAVPVPHRVAATSADGKVVFTTKAPGKSSLDNYLLWYTIGGLFLMMMIVRSIIGAQ